MKKMALVFALIFVLGLTGCGQKDGVRNTVQGNLKTYYEMSDGTWQCDGLSYQYRLEITGRMHDAANDSTFVYLSNLEHITFEQAWKASGLSSDSNDYFSAEDAVLVEMR